MGQKGCVEPKWSSWAKMVELGKSLCAISSENKKKKIEFGLNIKNRSEADPLVLLLLLLTFKEIFQPELISP